LTSTRLVLPLLTAVSKRDYEKERLGSKDSGYSEELDRLKKKGEEKV